MFSTTRRLAGLGSLIAGLVFTAGTAMADLALVPNAVNTFNDNSQEAFIDVDGSGTFNAGDVIVGYVRIESRSGPNPISLGDTTYAIFSQQVDTITGNLIEFVPTTVTGLTLDDLIGADAAPADGMVAVYTGAYDRNLIDVPPAGADSIADYFAFITGGGDLEVIAGFSDADDFFDAEKNIAGDITTATIDAGGSSLTFAEFSAALSILVNNTGFDFADDRLTNNPDGTKLAFAELSISSGTVRGANDEANNGIFTDASELTNLPQCATACGFIDNADFSVHPLQVPEPGSLLLLGAGLMALGSVGRRYLNRSKRAE